MAFTTVMTLTTDVDDSVITLWDEGIILGYTPELVVDQLATVKRQIGAKTIQFTKYNNLTLATSALTEDTDPASVALVDAAITITPVEQGNVVTTTKLANLQTGGKVDTAAALLVGRNMGATQDKLGMAVLEAFSTTVIWPNTITATTDLTADDVLDKKFANRLYNKLARVNVPPIDGDYFGIAHEDALFDLRESMTPVTQYQDLTSIRQNEVGRFAGIRWIRSSNSAIVDGGGAGTVDAYYIAVLGANAFGKAVSEEAHPVMSGPFDKLSRTVNIGWYGVFKYSIIDTGNMVLGRVASSVGANS